MYLLTNQTPADKLSTEVTDYVNRVITEARQRLSDSSEGLVFNQEAHKYFYGTKELISVSGIVQHYAPFDREKTAEECSRNPNGKYYGLPKDTILAIWDDVSANGTYVHAFGEACCLYRQGRQDEIEDEFKTRITKGGFAAWTPKEEAVAKWWDNLDLNKFAVVAKEQQVMNPIFSYAGTFDLLLYDIENRSFCLKDYKTNNDLLRPSRAWLKAPLYKLIHSDDVGKYTLQQNLYRIQLVNIGLPVSQMDLIWLKEDGNYQEVNLPDRENAIRLAMQNNPIKNVSTTHE